MVEYTFPIEACSIGSQMGEITGGRRHAFWVLVLGNIFQVELVAGPLSSWLL